MQDGAQQFASDNWAGMCPEAWRAMEQANPGSAPGYGDDAWTARAADGLRALFGTDCAVFFAFNGTASNALVLAHTCRSYNAVICADVAHIATDECGAPEFFSSGAKLLTARAPDGKLTPQMVRDLAAGGRGMHAPKPGAVSITQATEAGRIYRPDEIRAVSQVCRELGLTLHMDGARFANACASLGASPAELSWKAGVDVLCFGGTKNGAAVGDAIVFFDKALARDFEYRCKQGGQLASKMRFITAPWVGLLEDGVWLSNARHANACATRFADGIAGTAGLELAFPVEANGVFVRAGEAVFEGLRARGWRFHTVAGAARFMFGWDADPARVDQLAADMRGLAG